MTATDAPLSPKTGFIPSILLAVILNPLNSATISVGLVAVLRALHTNAGGVTWSCPAITWAVR